MRVGSKGLMGSERLSGEPESLLPKPRQLPGAGAQPCRERGVINPSNDEAHEVTYRRRQRLPSPSVLLRSQEAGVSPAPFLLFDASLDRNSDWGSSWRIFIPVSRRPCSRSPSPDAVHGQRRESKERTHETT